MNVVYYYVDKIHIFATIDKDIANFSIFIGLVRRVVWYNEEGISNY
jgi:hypothetical protein